jgi:hypothetical protein
MSMSYGSIRCYAFPTVKPVEKSPGAEVHSKVMRYRAEHPKVTYRDALHTILADPQNAELKRRFNQAGG